MCPNELSNPDNRRFMCELSDMIIDDHACVGGDPFMPDVRLQYSFARGGAVGRFVRSEMVLYDGSGALFGGGKKVLVVGDGVLCADQSGSGSVARLFQRMGIPQVEPCNLSRCSFVNKEYFGVGTCAREYLESKGFIVSST